MSIVNPYILLTHTTFLELGLYAVTNELQEIHFKHPYVTCLHSLRSTDDADH